MNECFKERSAMMMRCTCRAPQHSSLDQTPAPAPAPQSATMFPGEQSHQGPPRSESRPPPPAKRNAKRNAEEMTSSRASQKQVLGVKGAPQLHLAHKIPFHTAPSCDGHGGLAQHLPSTCPGGLGTPHSNQASRRSWKQGK